MVGTMQGELKPMEYESESEEDEEEEGVSATDSAAEQRCDNTSFRRPLRLFCVI